MRTRSALIISSLLLALAQQVALSGTSKARALSVHDALSVPLGTSVSLKGVLVDKTISKPPYIVVREPWATEERIVVLLSGAPGVSLQQTVDVTGSVTLLRNGYRAIEKAGIFAYTDRAGKVIKCPLPPGPSADSTIDITPAPSVSTARSDMSLMSEETPPAPDPGPTPTEPDYLIDMIADTVSIADGATVRINGKAISGTGTDPVYGPYFIAAEDGSTETIRAYTPEAATTSDRAVTLQGTLSTDSNGDKELSIGSGPATPPEGFLAQVLLAEIVTVAGAKASPDAPAATVALNNQVVTRCFPTQGLFYVRESDRSAGIRVKNAAMASQLQPGDTVSFSGTMKSEGFERYVDVTSPATGESGAPPNPLTTINRSIGGADGPYNATTGAGQKGVIGGSGLNNIGQLVRTTGKVAGVGLGFFYIDDGSALDDTTGHGKGLRVSLAWQTTGETPMAVPAAGAYVTITGISSCEHVGFDSSNNPRLIRLIRVRSAADIVTDSEPPGGGTTPNPYLPPPAWAEGVGPYDSAPVAGGPSEADSVDLSSGTFIHSPDADIAVNNPIGPDAVLARTYRSALATLGQSSAGLSSGWVHNYDIRIVGADGVWGNLDLSYPSGARETLVPQYSWVPSQLSYVPTGVFTPQGAPYIVTGETGSNTGEWNWIELRFADDSKWLFAPASSEPSTLLLTQIADARNNYITINRQTTSERLTSVTAGPSNITLLTFSYDGNGYLATASDVSVPVGDRTKVTYAFAATSSVTSLAHVSQAVPLATSTPADRWAYGYQVTGGKPYLNTVSTPKPNGDTGTSTHTASYNTSAPYVDKLVDANLHERRYSYSGYQTDLSVWNHATTQVDQDWTQKIGAANVDAGIIDHDTKSTSVGYVSSYLPWRITNKNRQKLQMTGFDNYGNYHQATAYPDSTARILQSNYAYDADPAFPLRIASTQVGAKTSTTFEYYPANSSTPDLLWKVNTPAPDTTSGAVRVTTTYEYTALGNVAKITSPGPNGTPTSNTPSVTVYDYASDPDYAADGVTPRSGSDPAYTVTEALGQPVRVSVYEGDPANSKLLSVVHYRYDSRGRLTKEMDASNNVTDTTYNDAGQAVEVLEPQVGTGRVRTAYTYAYVGGPLIKTNVYREDTTLFREVVYERGPEGEITGVRHLMVPTLYYEYEATYEYDAQYRVVKVTDGRGYPTKYEYDDVGNLTKLYLPSGIGTTESSSNMIWGYDEDHNLVSRLDGKGILTEYVLDDDDSHLVDVKYDSVPRFHFDFDIYGRLTGTDDYSGQTGQLVYTYDDQDLPQTASTTYPGLSAKTLAYTHFPDGSRKTMVTPAGTYNYAYAYNTTSQGLRVQTQPPWSSATLSTRCFYNASGQVVQQSHGRLATSYVYDARGFLTALRNVVDGSVYTSEFTGMLYDAAGNRTHATVSIPDIGGAIDRSGAVAYEYDYKDRLISEVRTLDSGGDLYSNIYTPDAADNLSPLRGLSFTFNPKNHSSAGVFDNNGNATSYSPDTGRSFGLGYDAENQPASVTGGLNSITMAYRPDGLRAWKDVDGSKTYFLYDGNELVSELNSAGTRTCSYVSGPNGLAQARRYASPFYEDYIYDPQGSLIQFDREGDTGNASRFTDVYDAFGRLWWSQSFTGSQTFAHPADLGYIAQWGVYTDWETKPSGDKTPLPLMGVRYYDPYTGRFLARDPIEDGLNWYSYANGNPVSFMDPSGLKSTGTYLGDVGQVFVGYGNILNPINAVRSGVQLYQVARKDGVKTAGKAAWQGVKSGYTTWLTTSDPTAFGESFGTVLTTAAAVAAPYAKAGVGAKVASAERLPTTGKAAPPTFASSRAGAAARFIADNWENVNFPNKTQAVAYHWMRHGKGAVGSIEQYTKDALGLYSQHKGQGVAVQLKNGSTGIRIRLGKGQPGGVFTRSGKIVTFWYK